VSDGGPNGNPKEDKMNLDGHVIAAVGSIPMCLWKNLPVSRERRGIDRKVCAKFFP
jgi:hypothetical protein